MKRCVALCSFCVLSLLVSLRIIWSAESEAPKQAPATYVGNEVCQACHAPAFEKFSQTMMGKIFLFNPRDEREKRACENCHGPGSNHVAAGGGKGVGGMITFRKDSGESARVQNDACLGCHQRGVQTLLGSWSPREPRADLCHLPSVDGEDDRQESARQGW